MEVGKRRRWDGLVAHRQAVAAEADDPSRMRAVAEDGQVARRQAIAQE